jgi:TolB protein
VNRISTFLILLPAVALAQAPVIQISGANFRPMPVAITPPLADAAAKGAAKELDEALVFDLAASGIFQVLNRKSFLANPKEGLAAGTIQFGRWSDVGADALVKTQVQKDATGVNAELRLYNVASSTEELKLNGRAAPGELRKLAHTFADQLYRHYTQEKGPFGIKLSFVKKGSQNKDIWIADWDGRNPISITQGGINLLPIVGPDGQSVAFTSYRGGGKPELYLGRPHTALRPLIRADGMPMGASFNASGNRLAYALSTGETSQIWVSRADGSAAAAITDSLSINTSPSWSPDGSRIAFVSNRGGSPQIYVMDAGGGSATRLTFQGNYNTTPEWSPRGDVIAFTARDERNAFDLFTVNANTRQIARLTQDQGNNEEPSYAPNGRLIVFSSNRNGWSQLFVMNADGTNQLPLPMPKGDYLTPDWGS